MNHSSSRSILISELLFIECCSIRSLALAKTVLCILVSMHCCEYWVFWSSCGLCIHIMVYRSFLTCYSVLFSTFWQESTNLLSCYVSAPVASCYCLWKFLVFLKLCCLLCFYFLSLLSGLCILWFHLLVPLHHSIPSCLCCVFLVAMCGMTVAGREEWFVMLVIRRNRSASCHSIAVLFLPTPIVYDGQLICYISTHSHITPSFKSPIMHHTVLRFPVSCFY